MIALKTKPNERGTGYFSVEFRDSTKALITPKSAKYSVFDIDGNVVNNLEDINIFGTGPILSSGEVVLTGADLAVTDGKNQLFFTVFIVFDSDRGTDLEETEQAKFIVNDFIGVD